MLHEGGAHAAASKRRPGFVKDLEIFEEVKVGLISIDQEKAFDRVDHGICLKPWSLLVLAGFSLHG